MVFLRTMIHTNPHSYTILEAPNICFRVVLLLCYSLRTLKTPLRSLGALRFCGSRAGVGDATLSSCG